MDCQVITYITVDTKKRTRRKKRYIHIPYTLNTTLRLAASLTNFCLTGILVYSPYCGRLFYVTMQKLATIRGFSIQFKTVIVSLTFFMINNYFHLPFFGLSWMC